MLNKKDIVAGLGEIGTPILKLFSKNRTVLGYDVQKSLMNVNQFIKHEGEPTQFLHICIPFGKNFLKNVLELENLFSPEFIVIHSTVSPYTTQKLQKKLTIPVIYSATRGVHKRMLNDMKRYTKFFALEKNAPNYKQAIQTYSNMLKKSNIKTKQMSSPITLELSKIVVDTSYYGWLINYAQISNMIAKKHNVDYDEMWSFSDEIHKFLGNRPKLFPGFIGGHCVIPNLELIDDSDLWQIDKINNYYVKKVKNAKTISKKYVKGKQSYNI